MRALLVAPESSASWRALDRDDLRVTAAGMKAQARDYGDGFAGLGCDEVFDAHDWARGGHDLN